MQSASNSIGTSIITVMVTLIVIAVVADWATNSNGPKVITGTSNIVSKIISVSLGKDVPTK